MDAFMVLAALRDGATSIVVLGDWPLRFQPGDPLRPPMRDDDQTHLHATYASHLNMDEAFCARMRTAIAAGLENAPIGVVTTPGTKNPKFIATELWPLACSLSDKEFV